MRIAIVGAGISGLATTCFLRHYAPECHITVIDKAPHVGGVIRTTHQDGFLFEHACNGFITGNAESEDTLELIRLARYEEHLISSEESARYRYLYTGTLQALPGSLKDLLKTPLLSLGAKLRLLAELWVRPKRDHADETLQSFGYRRIGKQATDTFLDALATGVFASRASELSVGASFPSLVSLEERYGSVIKGMIRSKATKRTLMSFYEGLGSFLQHLGEVIQADRVCLSSPVLALTRKEGRYHLKTKTLEETYDAVVLATPSYVSATLLQALDADLASRLAEIAYSPVAVVGLGYEALKHPLRGFGVLTTSASKQEVLGILWESSIFKNRAFNAGKTLRVLMGGRRNLELLEHEDESLRTLALDAVKHMLGIEETPKHVMISRYEKGIPHYALGHRQRMDALFEDLRLRHQGLYLTSSAYYGVAFNDCVMQAKRCAQAVLAGRENSL